MEGKGGKEGGREEGRVGYGVGRGGWLFGVDVMVGGVGGRRRGKGG